MHSKWATRQSADLTHRAPACLCSLVTVTQHTGIQIQHLLHHLDHQSVVLGVVHVARTERHNRLQRCLITTRQCDAETATAAQLFHDGVAGLQRGVQGGLQVDLFSRRS